MLELQDTERSLLGSPRMVHVTLCACWGVVLSKLQYTADNGRSVYHLDSSLMHH